MYFLVVSNFISIEDITKIKPKGIILAEVQILYEPNAPKCDIKILI